MNGVRNKPMGNLKIVDDPNQKGTAIVISLFVLALIGVFVTLALTRTATEAAAVGNETAEGKSVYAAQGSLEMMTRNFNKIFEARLNPLTSDVTNVETATVPGLSQSVGGDYLFDQQVLQITGSTTKVLSGGPYTGLYAIRDTWRLRTTATDRNGVQTQLTRNILNNRIPIFQFGIFYNDDLELFRPPKFAFGGRVHSNGNFFVSPGTEGVYFDSRVTAVGHIVTQSWRNWNTSDSANDQTWIKNASGTFKQLLPNQGSVLNTSAGAADNVFAFPPTNPAPAPTPNTDLPPSKLNPSWTTQSAIFDGNLQAQVPALRLPMNVGSNTDLIEMIRRGKSVGDLYNNAGTLTAVTTATADTSIVKAERFANKTGIRVSLADKKERLPGCASTVTTPVSTPCGVRLDGAKDGLGGEPVTAGLPLVPPYPDTVTRGYQPKAMKLTSSDTTWGYVPTRLNGERFHYPGPGTQNHEVWIKIETVTTDTTNGNILTKDITEDILSLGVTEEAPTSIRIQSPAAYNTTSGHSNNGTVTAPSSNITATTAQTASTFPDSRSIIKLQTFLIDGPNITTTPGGSGGPYLTVFGTGSTGENLVRRFINADQSKINAGCPTGLPSAGPYCTAANTDPNASSLENWGHLKFANFVSLAGVDNSTNNAIVPFPIELFDTREGTYFDDATRYSTSPMKVTRNGVMSTINIDVANLRRFLRGDFNGLFPDGSAGHTTIQTALTGTGLRACTYQMPAPVCDIPDNSGWVLYLSDRRGDTDFDGKYAMEDIYGGAPGNNGILDPGEDLEPVGAFGNGSLLAKYLNNAMSGCVGGGNDCEATKYADEWVPDRAAVTDHPFFRRGIRLINGTTIPGIYDSTTPANTKGFTVSSENGVYVEGNYNTTGVTAFSGTSNTLFDQYTPFNTPVHIPASIVADSLTALSNSWNDAESFFSPYNQSNRLASTTQMRFALITGDTISTKQNSTNQGSSVNGQNENGGVHNFKRFLEQWTNQRLDYAGSLINLYNSRNNNGSFKCCNTVYNPPIRNWVFDSTFLDPTRIPPGTPYFQYVQTTGFQRTND